MEKGELVVIAVILLGLSMFMFTSTFSGNTFRDVDSRPYCIAVCGGNLVFKQDADINRYSYTIKINDYFAVKTKDELSIFKFVGVTRGIGSDYINLKKVFTNKVEYGKKPKMNCGFVSDISLPVDLSNPLYTLYVHPSAGEVYEFSIPINEDRVKARLLHLDNLGRDLFKLHVDVNNDGLLGGVVNLELLRPHKVCDNLKPY